MTAFRKDLADETARVLDLVSRLEGAVRDAFADFIARVKSEAVYKAISDRLQIGDVEGALDIVGAHIERMGSSLQRVFITAATEELPSIEAGLGAASVTVAVSFNPADVMAAEKMRQNALEFVVRMTAQTREVIREALAESLMTGQGTEAQARAFRSAIGLAPSQARWVRNYERLLRDGSADALARDLRDRRHDRTVARAVRTGEPLTEDQIATMVGRYRLRALMYRSQSISRTETLRTVSLAREEAWRQNVAALGLAEQDVIQTWVSTQDHRVRDTHAALDGQERRLGQAFDSPSGASIRWPGDSLAPPEETIQCRCTRSFRLDLTRSGR